VSFALGEGQNVFQKFKPTRPRDMLIACLWSHWTGGDGTDLWFFSAVTDDPTPEISLAGHERCKIPIKPEIIVAWLNQDPADLAAQHAILNDKAQPFYTYRLAA
jgi:putative SOS response-associated peptidase YedK